MKRFLSTLLVVVMLTAMIPAVSLATTQYAAVVGGWLRLREKASFDSNTITSYYTDTVVEILGTSGKWYHVRTPDGRTGYMYGDYLKVGVSGAGSSANAYVISHNGYGVRLRKGPGTGYRVINTYAVGTPVTVLESGTYWSRISINGTTGYMMSQFLSTGTGGGNGNEDALCYATIWSSNGYGVRLRTGPGKGYGKIGVYSVGTVVAVLEKGVTWDRIRVGSRTGWMMNEFLNYHNTNEVTSVTINNLQPTVGTVLGVQAMSPSGATVKYEWYVDGSVKGTSSTYTVASADVGKSIQLKVTGTGSYSGSAWSAKTNKVISNTQISGLKLSTTAPVVGDALKATFTPADATVAYAWKVGGYQVSNQKEYTVAASDVGKTIELMVTGTGSYSGTLSATTSAVVASSALNGVTIRNDTNTGVDAVPMVGDQLSAVPSPALATATYQWKRNGTAITGATGAIYTLTDSDLGAMISVTATGTGSYIGTKTASLANAVAARPEKPTIDDYAMPEAIVGKTYATQLTAKGGGQMKWVVSGGSLPEGLSLSETGAITGTPVKDGSYSFSVKATNATGSDEKTFSITVVPVAKPQLTVGSVTLPSQTEGYDQPAPVAVTITNVGKANASLKLIWTEGTNGDSFIVNESGSTVIPAGATDTTWTVQPKAGLSAGTYQASFVVRYDGDETASAAVSFTVNAKSDPPVDPDPTKTYAVTVVNGTDQTGKSAYQAGETVSIKANAAESGYVFSGWTASSSVAFKDASAAETEFTMPASEVTVTANYTAVAEKKPQLQIAAINLPEVEEGYAQPAPFAIAIKNTGDAEAVLTALYPQGGQAVSFSVNENGSTRIAAGATDNTWTIQPVAGLSAGTYTTQFVAEYNGMKAEAAVTFTVKAKVPVTYQLTVENGTGSGNYTENENVALSASAPAEGKVFDRWTATAGTFANAESANTTFTMPAQNATVTATYKAKEKLAQPVITWSEDGTSVSWSAVSGATGYEFYRVKVGGEETSKSGTAETSYTFVEPAQTGDVFYVRAIDNTGTCTGSDYASKEY